MSEKGGVFYRNRVIITHRSVEQEKKVPRNLEVSHSFPIFHRQFVVLIKLSCCAPNFDIGPALTRIFDHGDDDGDWRVRISD